MVNVVKLRSHTSVLGSILGLQCWFRSVYKEANESKVVEAALSL